MRLLWLAILAGCTGAPEAPTEDLDGDGVAWPDDCDDGDPARHPGADEVCNGVDDDCDDIVDGPDADGAVAWYADADADGYGDPDAVRMGCAVPVGYVADASDCDDADPGAFPGAAEWCDGIDQDCDGTPDNDPLDLVLLYPDADGDGWGANGAATWACPPLDGYGVGNGDCDDADPDSYPGAPEIPYDGIDQGCDGGSDFDADGDGVDAEPYGGLDCDDAEPAMHPGVAERCDEVDWNCDGVPWHPEIATFVADAGAAIDLTPILRAGTPDAPVAWTQTESGTVSLCPGTWYAHFVNDGDSAVYQALAGGVTIDGGHAGTVIEHNGLGLLVVTDLTLVDGLAAVASSGPLVMEDVTISGHEPLDSVIEGWNDLTLRRVEIRDSVLNALDWTLHGGGEVLLEDVVLEDDDGGVSLSGGVVEVTRTTVRNAGYGVEIFGDEVVLTDLVVEESWSTGLLVDAVGDVTLTDVEVRASADDGISIVAGGAVHLERVESGGNGLVGLEVEGASALTAVDVAVIDSGERGLVLVDVPSATVEASRFEGNLGGGLLAEASTVTLLASDVVGNVSEDDGGGISVLDGAVTLVDTWVTDNVAIDVGGGASLSNGSLICDATGLGTGGFLRNLAWTRGGAVGDGDTPTGLLVESHGCDWGSGADDNLLVDISLAPGMMERWGSDADFTCTEVSGCY